MGDKDEQAVATGSQGGGKAAAALVSDPQYWLGRTFRASQRYADPTIALSLRSSLNGQHLFWTRMQGFLIHPAIEPELSATAAIADVGVGTGAWLLDVQRGGPPTRRLDGYDIDLCQSPHPKWLPPNVKMLQNDIYQEVPENQRGIYDLTHLRFFICVIHDQNPMPVLRNLMAMTKPGGWIQWTELDAWTLELVKASDDVETPASERFADRVKSVFHRFMGERPGWIAQLAETFEQAGLEDVRTERYRKSDDDLANFHDNWLLAIEEASYINTDTASEEDVAAATATRRLVQEAAQEFEQVRRGVAVTADGVTIIGRVPRR